MHIASCNNTCTTHMVVELELDHSTRTSTMVLYGRLCMQNTLIGDNNINFMYIFSQLYIICLAKQQ